MVSVALLPQIGLFILGQLELKPSMAALPIYSSGRRLPTCIEHLEALEYEKWVPVLLDPGRGVDYLPWNQQMASAVAEVEASRSSSSGVNRTKGSTH